MTSEAPFDPSSLPDYLPIYYKRLFPYGPYFKWLTYGGNPKSYFTNREFSFTLADDIYIRYQSFNDQQELEKEIQKRCPHKIDIGAVFSHKPKEHKTIKASAFQPQEKELVFDIDMTDYDDVRFCCSGADICKKCWPLMVVAIKVIDRALRDDFGFEHLLWVYSGRRGIHCWVCDESARRLSAAARGAVAEYLTLVKGGENKIRKVTLPDILHPSVTLSIEIVRGYFPSYAVDNQDFLSNEDKYTKVLSIIQDDDLRDGLVVAFNKDLDDTGKRWSLLQEALTAASEDERYGKSKHALEEIMLQFCYPRLDINVSKGINHLLKSPFCVHPKTGKVCVPIDPAKVDSFDPDNVPTISTLCEELNNVEKEDDDGGKKIRDYRKTSLNEYLAVFDMFLRALENARKIARQANE